ncbi:MAG: redoxin domain-containing protein [Planctomycetaceae bacterium]|nr:redoxin domain-containing protein [Planctomycetaceae bacterium]
MVELPTTPEKKRPSKARIGLILLALAAVAIFIVTLWRIQQLRGWQQQPQTVRSTPRALAPRFEVADHNRHLVKFERFLGRQRVLLIFFDAELGPLKDPRLSRVLECFEQIEGLGVEVVAVSSATPFANGEAEKNYGKPFPFPLLTDIDPNRPVNLPVHRQWGRFDEKTEKTQTGLFLVERDGTIPLGTDGLPQPVENEQAALDSLCSGQWPDTNESVSTAFEARVTKDPQ